MARELHELYIVRQRTIKSAGDPALQAWSTLSPWLKRSNLAVIDDIPAKLTVLGLRLEERPAGKPEDELVAAFEAKIDYLAELEHGRFIVERLLSGWTSGVRDPARFVSPHLLPWTELSDEAKGFDRDVMRNLPIVLAHNGLGAVRVAV